MGAEDRQNVMGVVIFLSNIVSSISIIMINKQLMGSAGYGFNFGACDASAQPVTLVVGNAAAKGS
jgi:hypothetical protein